MHSNFIYFLVFLQIVFNSRAFSQGEKRVKLTDSVFVNRSILIVPEIRFSHHIDWITKEYFSEETALILDDVVAFLNKHPKVELLIECHTDSRGTDTANLRFSNRKSEELKNALLKRGADSLRVHNLGFGENKPALVYVIDGEHFEYLENPPEKATQVRLTETYINQFKTDKQTFDKLHQFNRRTIFRLILTTE